MVGPFEELCRSGDRGLRPVDLVDAGNGPEPELPALDDGHGAAVDIDERGARVRDGLHHAVEVERRRDLPAHGEKGVELFDPAFGPVAPGVVQGSNGLVAEVGQEKGVRLLESGAPSSLVDDDHDADRLFVFEERERQNGRNGERAFLPEEMLGGELVLEGRLPRADRVAHDGGADGIGRMGDLVVFVDRRRREGDFALVSLQDPERRGFGVREVHGLPRDDRRELVPVQRGAERLREVVQVRQALDRVEHAGRLLVLLQAARDRLGGIGDERGEVFVGGDQVRVLFPEKDGSDADHPLVGFQRKREAAAEVPGAGREPRVVRNQDFRRSQREGLAIPDQPADEAVAAGNRLLQDPPEPFASCPRADENGLNRVLRPDERGVGPGEGREPARRPGGRVRERLAREQFGESGRKIALGGRRRGAIRLVRHRSLLPASMRAQKLATASSRS